MEVGRGRAGEQWPSNEDYLLIFQRTRVLFPASTLGSSQPSFLLLQKDATLLVSFCTCAHVCTCMHVHGVYAHTCTHTNTRACGHTHTYTHIKIFLKIKKKNSITGTQNTLLKILGTKLCVREGRTFQVPPLCVFHLQNAFHGVKH